MSVIGLATNTKNPIYSINDFTFWMPIFKKYMSTEAGVTMFNNLYPIADDRILYSVFGTDWKYAMSLCIAHYAWLIAAQEQTPSGDSLASIFGGGVVSGVLSSASIGSFSKSYSLEYTMLTDEDAFFWNQSKFGQQLYALFKTKTIAKIFVVTPTNMPAAGFSIARNDSSAISKLSWHAENCTYSISDDKMTIRLDNGVSEASVRTSYQGMPDDALLFNMYGTFSIKLNDKTVMSNELMNGRTTISVGSVLNDGSAEIQIVITVHRNQFTDTASLQMEILR